MVVAVNDVRDDCEMERVMEKVSLYVLVGLAIVSLACAGRKADEEKTMCDRPANTWKSLSKKTKQRLEKACDIKGNTCVKNEDMECRATWTYGAQYYTLERWRLQHRKAPTIDKLDAYITYFLKPTFRMHEEYWGKALTNKTERQTLARATSMMREESKMLTDDFIVSLRNEIKQKTNAKERALLIEAYSIMKRLNTKAFEPFDAYDTYRTDVREKLERYEKIKIQLEFVDSPTPQSKPEDTKPTPDPAKKPEPKPEPKPEDKPTPEPATTPKVVEPPKKTSPEPIGKPESTTTKTATTSDVATKTKAKKKEVKDTSVDITQEPDKKTKGKKGVDDQWKLD